jgi:predicted dehydrogenase
MNSRRKLRVGMIGGGGPVSFRGAPHRRAILMDNSAELSAGALRSKPDDSLAAAADLFFTRGYADWQSLIASESSLPESERIDYLTIVTPSSAHFGPAETAASAGLPLVCEQPLTTTLDEARALHALVVSHEVPFIAAHTYTGYPMVMLARELVREGEIGEIRKVEAWYSQGWLSRRREDERPRQSFWRVDPTGAGVSGCGGDLGTHAYQFVRFVAGLHAVRLLARMKSIVPGRPLDDDFTVLAELNNGAIATITASQITTGAQNDNGFRIMGTTGTLVWSHTHFAVLERYAADQPVRVYRQGSDYSYLPGSIRPYLRLPGGHPEGFHEALANLHRTIEWTIRRSRGEPAPPPYEHPGIADGLAGMAFLEAAVQSASGDGIWVDVPRGG